MNAAMTTAATARPRAALGPFLAWASVGAGACLAVLSVLSIGIFVLPVAATATIVLLRWPAGRTMAVPGLISGLGLPLLYVAYLNRGGPGQICVTTATGQSCEMEWSPWPWLAAGTLLAVAGIAAFAALRSRLSR
jgi:hypothetical protein